MKQLLIFPNETWRSASRQYSNVITVSMNRKGVLDVDTVKGCSPGMTAYPDGGCYNECYAYKNARTYGFDFRKSISRQFMGREHKGTLIKLLIRIPVCWYRVGTAGDPCYDWTHTVAIINALWHAHKIPVIITKHWTILEDSQIEKLRHLGAVVNTSTSGMDTDSEIAHRIGQFRRLRDAGIKSVLRVVTCEYGASMWARECREKQSWLMSLTPVIDNPLRARQSNPRVVAGDIVLTRVGEAVGGGKYVSLVSKESYIGHCRGCPDQCGVDSTSEIITKKENLYEDQTVATLPF